MWVFGSQIPIKRGISFQLISPHVEDYTRFAAEQNGKEYNPPATCSSRLIDPITEEKEPEPAPDEPPLFDVDQFLTTVNMAIDEHLTRAVGKVFQVRPIRTRKGTIAHSPLQTTKPPRKLCFERSKSIYSGQKCHLKGSTTFWEGKMWPKLLLDRDVASPVVAQSAVVSSVVADVMVNQAVAPIQY